jgi:MoxR-like ATPase
MNTHHQDLIDALALCIQAHIPVLLFGKPGIGKTSTITKIAEILQRQIEVVIASIREPSDFCGLPFVDKEKGCVNLASPGWAQRLCEYLDGILFLDELSAARPATQVACLRVVLEMIVGDLRLPRTTSIVAAANRTDDSAGMSDLISPLSNRFLHLSWSLDVDTWIEGMQNGFETNINTILPADWEDDLDASTVLITQFIKRFPHLLEQTPADETKAGEAWASPRSWDIARRALTAWRAVNGRMDVLALLISGAVGSGPAINFTKWLQELDLPDPESLLNNPYSVVAFLPAGRSDKVYAVLSSVVSAVLRNNTVDRYYAGIKIMSLAGKSFLDLAYPHVRRLLKNVPAGATTAIPELSVFDTLKNVA